MISMLFINRLGYKYRRLYPERRQAWGTNYCSMIPPRSRRYEWALVWQILFNSRPLFWSGNERSCWYVSIG